MRAAREKVHRWFSICELSFVTLIAVWPVWKYREPLLLALPICAFALLATVIWADWLHQHSLSGADVVILLLVSGYDLLEWLRGHTTTGILLSVILGAIIGRAIKRIVSPPSAEEIAARELRLAKIREKFEQRRTARSNSTSSMPRWMSEFFPWLCASAFFFYPWHTSNFRGQNLYLSLVLFAYLILRTIIIRLFPPANSRIKVEQPPIPLQNGDSA